MRELPIDAPLSESEWKEFVQNRGFGELVAWSADGAPPVVVPLNYTFDSHDTVEFHLARTNPVWDRLRVQSSAMLCVTGAYAYIPTHWNVSRGGDPHWSVPTSYYASVQLTGPVELIEQPEALAEVLTRQMKSFQAEGGYHAIRPDDSPYGRMLPAIIAARLQVGQVKARFKFGNNKTPEHRRDIAERLRDRGRAEDLEARSYMLRRLGEEA